MTGFLSYWPLAAFLMFPLAGLSFHAGRAYQRAVDRVDRVDRDLAAAHQHDRHMRAVERARTPRSVT